MLSAMAVLTEPRRWRRERVARARRSPDILSPEESAAVRRALVFLRTKLGGGPKLAEALGVGEDTLSRACWGKTRPGAGLALRTGKLAGVPVEAVLGGAWPPEGACPHCGRGPLT